MIQAAQIGTSDPHDLLGIAERLRHLNDNTEVLAIDGDNSHVPLSEAQETKAETAPGARRIRVLLADDHRVTRQGLAYLLGGQHDLEVVGEATDGREAVAMANRLHPDVVVMDVNMPRLNGIDATREIVAVLPQTRVIGLSMYEPADVSRRFRKAGAAAFLTKGGSCDELIAAIRGGRPSS